MLEYYAGGRKITQRTGCGWETTPIFLGSLWERLPATMLFKKIAEHIIENKIKSPALNILRAGRQGFSIEF
jgi:hypothetical protein